MTVNCELKISHKTLKLVKPIVLNYKNIKAKI